MNVIAEILANLPALIQDGETLIRVVTSIRQTAQQAGEWDASHETAFQTILTNAATSPESIPDPVKPPGANTPPGAA